MEIQNRVEWLRQRFMLPLPGKSAHEKMIGSVLRLPDTIPDGAKLSAVLCLLFPNDGELNLLLMKRKEDNRAHSGQISFPGGRYEKTDENLLNTALREAQEETGIDISKIEIFGAMTPVYIPVSNYKVCPYLGYATEKPEYEINNDEVDYTIEVSLSDLLHADRKTKLDVFSPAIKQTVKNVNAYKLVNGTVIWGATAMIISELETTLSERW